MTATPDAKPRTSSVLRNSNVRGPIRTRLPRTSPAASSPSTAGCRRRSAANPPVRAAAIATTTAAAPAAKFISVRSYSLRRIPVAYFVFRVKITYGELSSTGPVRPHNEDYVAYWEPETDQARTTRGAVALLADGVGGQGFGEIASRLAIDTALKVFQEADPSTTDNQLLWRMFNAANLAVYDAGMAQGGTDRMATTLTVSLFRRNEVAVGHVGDSRAYLVRQGTIKQLTADHAYVAMQVKMGLISKQDAMTSELRGLLTRSIGANPTVQVDYAREVLRNGDIVVQCSDGLHGCVTENEI